MMIEKVFNQANIETKENTRIHFSSPKVRDGKKISPAIYLEDGEKCAICYETNQFVLKNGIQKTQSGKYLLDLHFDDTNQALYDFITEIDELAITKVWENSKKWFGQQIDQDMVDHLYKYPLRAHNKESETKIRLKVDSERVLVKTQFNKKIELSEIGSNSNISIKIQFAGLVYYRDAFTPEYNVVSIKYYRPMKKDEEFQFTNESDLPNYFDALGNETETEFTQHYSSVKKEEPLEGYLQRKELSRTEVKDEKSQTVEEQEKIAETEKLEDDVEGKDEEKAEFSGSESIDEVSTLTNNVQVEERVEEILEKTKEEEKPMEQSEIGEILTKTVSKLINEKTSRDEDEPLEFSTDLPLEDFLENTMKMIKNYLVHQERSNTSFRSETSVRSGNIKLGVFKGATQSEVSE